MERVYFNLKILISEKKVRIEVFVLSNISCEFEYERHNHFFRLQILKHNILYLLATLFVIKLYGILFNGLDENESRQFYLRNYLPEMSSFYYIFER